MQQWVLPWFEEYKDMEEKENKVKGESNHSLNKILSIEYDKCPSCDEMSFHNWVCESCGYGKEVKNKENGKTQKEVDITKVLNFDSNENHIKEFFNRLNTKDNCRMWFILFWEFFDIEIVNGWVDEIEVSWLTFKYNPKDWKFLVVVKQKWFLRWNAYKYKRHFLEWIWKNKKKFNSKNNSIQSHPYFDDFLWK